MPAVSRYSRQLADQIAQGLLHSSLAVDNAAVSAGISLFPVRLEPVFIPLDPITTYRERQESRMVHAGVRNDWLARRIFLPPEDDRTTAPAAMLSGLAGSPVPLAFEAVMTSQHATLYLVAPKDTMGFFADAWQDTHPSGGTFACSDPLRELPAVAFLLDFYAPASYDRLVTSPGSFWGALSRLATALPAGEVIVYQVIFEPARSAWQQNIAALAQGLRSRSLTKSLDEPLFAAVIRIICSTTSLAVPLTTFCGRFTAAGLPFRYRTLADYSQALTPPIVQGLVRQRSSHVTGQLLTSSELALFVHAPSKAIRGCHAI